MSKLLKWAGVAVAAMWLGLQASVAFAAPQVGWWWNPAENGRGFFIEMKGNQLFMAGYFYADDGRGMWAVSGGPITDTSHYSGRLLTVSGGQTLTGTYHAPTSSTDLGPITLTFTDDTHGTMTWPGGSVQIERQVFGGTAQPSFQPSGWWWNANESGRGYSVEVQGDTMFFVAFMYDGAGNPVWYISTGKMSSPTHFAGLLQTISGGQTLTGAYKPPTTSTNVGAVTIDFASLESATFTLSDVPALKTSVTFTTTPQLPNPPLSDLPGKWGGTYDAILVNDPPGPDTLTVTATGDVAWGATTAAPPGVTFATTATPSKAYVITGGTAKVHITGTASLPVLGQNVTCSVAGDSNVSLATIFGASYLLFEANGTVTGQIATLAPVPFSVVATCATPVGSIVLSPQYPVSVNFPLKGRHRYNHSEGSDPLHTIAPNVSAGATWSFNGIP
jgi:hypothetical protein